MPPPTSPGTTPPRRRPGTRRCCGFPVVRTAPHDARRPVGFEDAALAIDHHDRIRHGVHEEPQIALRRRGSRERVHQRPGLARDLALEQRRVATVGAGGMDSVAADDHDRQRDEHGTPTSGSADNAFLIADRADAGEPITSAAMRAALPEMVRALASPVRPARGGRHGRGGGEQQEPRGSPSRGRARRPNGTRLAGRWWRTRRWSRTGPPARTRPPPLPGEPGCGAAAPPGSTRARRCTDGPGDAREQRRDAVPQGRKSGFRRNS